jgi:hypothetical protein
MRAGIEGSFSRWMEVFSGIPQGLLLASLPFILFIQGLPVWISDSMMMFAGDTKVRYLEYCI